MLLVLAHRESHPDPPPRGFAETTVHLRQMEVAEKLWKVSLLAGCGVTACQLLPLPRAATNMLVTCLGCLSVASKDAIIPIHHRHAAIPFQPASLAHPTSLAAVVAPMGALWGVSPSLCVVPLVIFLGSEYLFSKMRFGAQELVEMI